MPRPNFTPVDQIVAANHKRSRFEVRIRRGYVEVPAELTFNLNEASPARRLLRINEKDALRLWPELARDPGFCGLKSLINEKASQDIANLSIAKGIVIALDAHQHGNSLGIAVHRMGPVPVLMLPKLRYCDERNSPVTISMGGVEFEPAIGVYPSFPDRGRTSTRPTKTDLMRSYPLGLNHMLRKYLEDVGAYFHDLENLSRREAFRVAGLIEETLSLSIDGKLNDILLHHQNAHEAELHMLASDMGCTYRESIVLARHASTYARYLVNQLYEVIGAGRRGGLNENTWGTVSDHLRDCFGVDEYEQVMDSDAHSRLAAAFTAYRDHDYVRLDSLIHESPDGWLCEFIRFARFLLYLRADNPVPGSPRVFFSSLHGEPAVRGVYREVERGLSRAGVRLVCVESEGGRNFRQAIRTRIWSSDFVLVVIPRDWVDSEAQSKDLTWIVREIDHALVLDRPIELLVQKGTDARRIEEEFARVVGDLGSEDGVDAIRQKRRVMAQVRDFAYVEFREPETWLPGPAWQHRVEQVAQKAAVRHSEDLVLGFFERFLSPDRRTLARMLHKTTMNALSRKALCKVIAEETGATVTSVAAAVSRAWRKIKDWEICIGGRKYSPVELQKRRYYKSKLMTVLRELLPGVSDDELLENHNVLLGRISGI